MDAAFSYEYMVDDGRRIGFLRLPNWKQRLIGDLREAIWKQEEHEFVKYGLGAASGLSLWTKGYKCPLGVHMKLTNVFKEDEDNGVCVTPHATPNARFKEKPPPDVAYGSPAEEILKVFGAAIHKASLKTELIVRQRNEALPLRADGSLYSDISSYFPVLGRENTVESLLLGGAQIFQSWKVRNVGSRREVFFMLAVAFPGAGKTTLGVWMDRELRRLSTDPIWRAKVLTILHPGVVPEFEQFMINSLAINCTLYHDVETKAGDLFPEEKLVSMTQVLAWRTLHAALFDTVDENNLSYSEMLNELGKMKSFRTMTIFDVFHAIRLAMGISPTTKMMFTFFFYEINLGSAKWNGTKATWFHAMWDEYITAFLQCDEFTLPLMLGATTSSTVGSLSSFQDSKFSRAVPIPLRPLHGSECQQILDILWKRLHLTLNDDAELPDMKLPAELYQAFQYCGGMPRIMGRFLTILVTNVASHRVNPKDLLKAMEAPFYYDNVVKILDRLNTLLINRVTFTRYANDNPYILEALRVAVLGKHVCRNGAILDDKADTWGKLEKHGLIAFMGDLQGEDRSVVDCDEMEGTIRFCPILLFQLFRTKSGLWESILPSVQSADWRGKEVADCHFLVFSMLLLKNSRNPAIFSLSDICPQHWSIPDALQHCRFRMPEEFRRVVSVGQMCTAEKFVDCMKTSDRWAFLGPGNFGADSWIILEDDSTNRRFLLLIQSRCNASPYKVVYKTLEGILFLMNQDCGRWVAFPIATITSLQQEFSKLHDRREYEDLKTRRASLNLRELKEPPNYIGKATVEVEESVRDQDLLFTDSRSGWRWENFGFFYMIDEKITKNTLVRHSVAARENLHSWASHLAICGQNKLESGSPLELLSQLRHIVQFAPAYLISKENSSSGRRIE